ncbi:MAG: glycerophosphodiester phosphodiesterase family protein [Candidatus Atabeyarchaeum deiterrae]
MKTYKIVAHRGASAYEPENTIIAIRRAIDMHADMVEIDVHTTKDKQLVVIHDAEVDRTTKGKGSIKDMSLKEIRRLDAGKGEKIPTLQEVLELSRDAIGVMIEVKGIGIEKLLVDLLQKEKMLDKVVATSFMTDIIKKVKELEPKIPTGQIFSWRIPHVTSKVVELKADYVLPAYELLTKEMIEESHRRSILVFTWTVDDRHLAERLVEMGVDGIVTNKPDLMSPEDA